MTRITGVSLESALNTITSYDQSTMGKISDYIGKILAELHLKSSKNTIEPPLTENEVVRLCDTIMTAESHDKENGLYRAKFAIDDQEFDILDHPGRDISIIDIKENKEQRITGISIAQL